MVVVMISNVYYIRNIRQSMIYRQSTVQFIGGEAK